MTYVFDSNVFIAWWHEIYPKLIKQHRKFNADPIVIALAEANGWTVVTQENQKKQNNIVGCCRNVGIDCISLSEYIKQNRGKLNIIRQNIVWQTN